MHVKKMHLYAVGITLASKMKNEEKEDHKAIPPNAVSCSNKLAAARSPA
jgi:hypothetical protein